MFRKFFRQLKSRHFPLFFALTSILFVSATGILYWQWAVSRAEVLEPLFLLFLVAALIWSFSGVISLHVSWRDGFLDGYEKGYQKGREDGLSEAGKSTKKLQE